MPVSHLDVINISKLSRIEISDSELNDYSAQLNAILDYIALLNTIDTSEIEPTFHVIPIVNVMREDKVTSSLPRAVALCNAPEVTDKFYKTPKIIE